MDRKDVRAAFKALCLILDSCDECTREHSCNWHSLFIGTETNKATERTR